MNKMIPILLTLSLASIMGALIGNELEEGLKAGREALYHPTFSQNLNEVVQSEAMQDLLNQSDVKDVHLDKSAVSGTANHLIQSSNHLSGKALNQQLLRESQALKVQEEAVQLSGIESAGLSPEQAERQSLTPNQIINQNLLQMETFPNVRSPATEPAFQMVESQDVFQEKTFMQQKDFEVSLQEDMVTEILEEAITEPYEMGCSTTLLGNTFQCDKTLVIKTEPQAPIPLKKTITTHFSAHAYNIVSFTVHFKTGLIQLTQGRGATNFSMSDKLGDEFGPNTQVKLRYINPHSEGGVRHTVDLTPSYVNGFLAAYTAFQPNTHKKKNRYHWRGATLVYEFSDTKAQPPRVTSETWKSDCEDLEELTHLGECHVVQEQCLEGPAIRQFGTEAPFLTLDRPCWKKRFLYQCQVPQGADDCGLIPKDCQKIDSEFKDFLNQHAVEIHRFSCHRTIKEKKEVTKNRGRKFIPIGDYQKNNDIAEAIAGLNIAKEMLNGFRGEFRGQAGLFFRGKPMHCTCKPKNCCGDKKGFWRKMTGCREEEQQLAVQLNTGNCHEVGQYRVKKSALQKIGHVEKKGYCCFQSKLSRIIQIGARRQLPSLQWGTPEAPDCRALTLAEIEMLDWSQIDFSEMAEEIINKSKNMSLNPAQVTVLQNSLRAHLETTANGLKNNYPNTGLGKKQQIENLELNQKIKAEDNKRRLKGRVK
jgi:hypothetical protein